VKRTPVLQEEEWLSTAVRGEAKEQAIQTGTNDRRVRMPGSCGGSFLAKCAMLDVYSSKYLVLW
jgi:hypothetical protein